MAGGLRVREDGSTAWQQLYSVQNTMDMMSKEITGGLRGLCLGCLQ